MCATYTPSGSPGNGAVDGCEPARECWESNLGLLQDQVTLSSEPSTQAQNVFNNWNNDSEGQSAFTLALKARGPEFNP